MKDVDARLIKDMGFPETVLIENAGRAVAEEACAFLGGAARKRIVLLCGKGNNGGDGLAALRFLSRFGASCSLIGTDGKGCSGRTCNDGGVCFSPLCMGKRAPKGPCSGSTGRSPFRWPCRNELSWQPPGAHPFLCTRP